MRVRGWGMGGLLLVSLMAAGCKKKAAEAPEVAVTVEAARPVVGPIAEEIAADAILAPVAAAALSPRISAPIRAEYVQKGQRVRRGQLLVSLDDRDLQGMARDSSGAVLSAKANLTATTQTTIPEETKKAEGEVAQLRAALEVATRTARERQRLFEQGALAGRDADAARAAEVQAQAAFDAARQHLSLLEGTTRTTDRQAAEGQLESAEGRLENARAQVGYGSMRSPIDGVVTDRPLFPGETAAAGSAVITVMDTSSLLAKLHLAQASAQKLGVGDRAEVTVPGVDEPVEAKVALVSPAVDAGSTTVEVWLKLANADGRLKVGTPVHAVMRGRTVRGAVQVPPGALVPAEDGSTDVVVVGADGTVKKEAVTVGIRTAKSVQILTGLNGSEMVVTEGGYGLENGTKVTVGKADAAAGDKD